VSGVEREGERGKKERKRKFGRKKVYQLTG